MSIINIYTSIVYFYFPLYFYTCFIYHFIHPFVLHTSICVHNCVPLVCQYLLSLSTYIFKVISLNQPHTYFLFCFLVHSLTSSFNVKNCFLLLLSFLNRKKHKKEKRKKCMKTKQTYFKDTQT